MRILVGFREPSKSATVLPSNPIKAEERKLPAYPDKRLRRTFQVDGETVLAKVAEPAAFFSYPLLIDLLTKTRIIEVEKTCRWRIVGQLLDDRFEPLAEVYLIKDLPVLQPYTYSVRYFNVLSRDRRHIVESDMAYSSYEQAVYRAKEKLYTLLTNSRKYANFFKEEP